MAADLLDCRQVRSALHKLRYRGVAHNVGRYLFGVQPCPPHNPFKLLRHRLTVWSVAVALGVALALALGVAPALALGSSLSSQALKCSLEALFRLRGVSPGRGRGDARAQPACQVPRLEVLMCICVYLCVLASFGKLVM